MMEFDEKDSDVVQLLTQLRNAEGQYPVEMMAARREIYVKQLAALGLGAGAGQALKAAGNGSGPAIPPVASTLLETVLIVAIVVEAAAVTIMNRDKVTEVVRTISNRPSVQEVSDTIEPLTDPSPSPETVITALSPTVSATPTATPSPALLFGATEAANNEQANGTADPNGNNGNHYGQTPEPERTKQSGNDTKPKKDPKDK